MNTTLFIVAFFALSLFYIYLGLKSSKGMKGKDDFYLASRDLGVFSVCMTLIATQLGGGALLGTANQSYSAGSIGIFYNIGMCLGFIIMGLGVAVRWRNLNVTTVSEVYTKKYNSELLKSLAGFFSAASLFGALVAQVVASKSVLTALGVNNDFVFIGFWAFVILYTIIGGLKAVVVTDKVQVGIIFVGFIFVAGYIFTQVDFPAATAFVMNAEKFPTTFAQYDMTSLLIVPIMFSLIQQDLGQRVFSAKNAATARKAAILAGIALAIFSCVPVILGGMARYLNLEVAEGASALVLVLKQYLSPSVLSLVMCAVLAAIISTADSLICAISSNLDVDLKLNKFLKLDDLKFSRLLTLLIGIAALILGSIFKDILGVLLKSYELPVAAMFVTVLLALFKDQVSRLGAYFSMLTGTVLYFYFLIFPETSFPSILISVGASGVMYLIGQALERSPQNQSLKA